MNNRIVIVSPAYPYRGGQALVETHLFETLTKLGYECRTISFRLLYPRLFFPGTTQFDDSGTIFFDHRDRIERIINSVSPLSWIRAARRIARIDPAVTFFVWWMPFFAPAFGTIAFLLRRFASTKIVFLIENYVSHERRWFDALASKLALAPADAFICESGYTSRSVTRHHPGKPLFQTTLSVYDCYDMRRYNRTEAKKALGLHAARVVLFFGLIRPYKGLDKLIEAFPLLDMPDTMLLIAGECYDDIGKYRRLIAATGVQERIVMRNEFIPNEKIEPYFKAADVVCLPYNSASQSGILMMAYGFRRPVVVTNVGGLPELVVEGKTGTVVPDNAPQNLADGIRRVLSERDPSVFERAIGNLAESLGYRDVGTAVHSILSLPNRPS